MNKQHRLPFRFRKVREWRVVYRTTKGVERTTVEALTIGGAYQVAYAMGIEPLTVSPC